MLISSIGLVEERVRLVGKNINGIFFKREKIFVLIKEEENTSINFVEILFGKSSDNSGFEELRIYCVGKCDLGEYFEVIDIEIVKGG